MLSRRSNRGKILRQYSDGCRFEYPNELSVARWKIGFFLLASISLSLVAMIYGQMQTPVELLSPLPAQAQTVGEVKEVVKVIDKNENVDTWIGNAVDEFLPSHTSEGRKIMHCLANQESEHGSSKAHGDSGKAGGPFQFHEPTWQRMRSEMVKTGLAREVGSRYDFKEAARTTAWAIAHGSAKEWGPILRESNGNHFASCPVPSWYKTK